MPGQQLLKSLEVTPVYPDKRERKAHPDRGARIQRPVQVKLQGFSPSVTVRANLDVKEGGKVVVGKTGIEGNQRALLLVVTGKIVD
jgi:hypothetical protein